MKRRPHISCLLVILFCSLGSSVSAQPLATELPEKVQRALALKPARSTIIHEIEAGAGKAAQSFRLTTTGGDKWTLNWSFDGQRITYAQDEDIFIIPATGGEPVNLTASIEGYCMDPAFMPGTKRISFTRYDYGSGELAIEFINYETYHHEVILTNALAGCWSSDVKYFVYRVYSTSELWIYKIEEDVFYILAEGDDSYGRSSFSPDNALVITSQDLGEGSKLVKIPVEGGGLEQIAFSEGFHSFPDCSPVSPWILYTVYNEIEDMWYLRALNGHESIDQRLMPESPDWIYQGNFSPDGEKFCVIIDLGGDTEIKSDIFINDFPFAQGNVPFLALTSTYGGKVFSAGEEIPITWNYNVITTCRLEYSIDGGSSWHLIADTVNTSYQSIGWYAPDVNSDACLIRIVDSANDVEWDVSEPFKIQSGEEPYLMIVVPNGGEELLGGAPYNIVWESVGVQRVNIEFITEKDASWKIIGENIDAEGGYFTWEVPIMTANQCLVKVSSTATSAILVEDVSDGYFSIVSEALEPTLSIKSPQGGEVWEAGTSQEITWESENVDTVTIEYSKDDGTTWIFIESGVQASDRSYWWVVPDTPSNTCLIKITSTTDADVFSVGSDYFSIISAQTEQFVTLLFPAGGESFQAGETLNIMWDSAGIASVIILVTFDGGETWSTVAESVPADDEFFTWSVPAGVESNDCYLWIGDTNNYEIGTVNYTPFSITAGATEPSITVVSPNGGEYWETGSSQEITWVSSDVNLVNILYSTDNGITWNIFAEGYDAAAGSYLVTIGDTVTSEFLIRIVDSERSDIFDVSDEPFSTVTGPLGPTLVFKYQTGDEISLSSPAIGPGGIVYIASLDSYLYAIKPDGTSQWKVELDNFAHCTPTVVQDGTIYIGTYNGTMYAINPDSSIKWKYSPYNGAILSSPAVGADGTIYFATFGRTLFALSPNGQEKWQRELNVDGVVFSSPAIGIDGTIYLGTEDGTVFAFDSEGNELWASHLGGTVFSSPAIGGDGTIYIGSSYEWDVDTLEGYLYALNPDGSMKWNTLVGSAVESSPVIGPDGTVYIGAEGPGKLHAINPVNGTILWSFQYSHIIVSTPAVGQQGTIYFGGDDFHIYAMNPNGTLKWGWTTGGPVWSSPTIGNNGVVYVGSKDGCLYALDTMTGDTLADSPWPKFQHDISNTGRFFTEMQTFVRVKFPNGGQMLVPGQTYAITWEFSGVTNVKIELSTDGGSTWSDIVATTSAASGLYTWDIPSGIDSPNCLIRITDTADSAINDSSNSVFYISPSSFIEVVSPAGGEKWQVSSPQQILWDSNDVSLVNIFYSTDGGTSWQSVAADYDAAGGSYTWTVPSTVSNSCKIRINDAENAALASDDSEGFFSITAAEFITVTSPGFGNRWSINSTKDITWEFSGVTNVKIELSTDGGSTWSDIVATMSAASGSYTWDIPSTVSDQCIIRISDASNSDISGQSGEFSLIQPELTISHSTIPPAQENKAIVFTADVTSSTDITEVIVYWDITGNREFTNELTLSLQQDNTYSGTLGVGIFTAQGIEYYISAKDVNNKKATAPTDGGFYAIRAIISDIKSTDKVTGGSEQNAYRMISIPLELSATSIESQLDGRLPTGTMGPDWRIFRFPPGSTTPDEYPNTEAFAPGMAFWLICRYDFRLEAPQGMTVTTSEPFSIILKAGWNDIANPWMFNIRWDDIENPSGATIDGPFAYNGSWKYPSGSNNVLEQWTGYTVNNMTNMNVIIKFNPQPASKPSAPSTGEEEVVWMLNAVASADGALDNANHFGLRRGASEEWDRFDHLEPPVIGEYVSVRFPHQDWSLHPHAYTVDFRPPSTTNLAWNFDVSTNIEREQVRVSFEGLETLPDGWDIAVIDRDTGEPVMLTNGEFAFLSDRNITERRYTVHVGDTANPEFARLAVQPVKFMTAQCFPNPFNPATTIRYELPKPGNVVITIFNAAGQRVEKYDLGIKSPGAHDFIFDASMLTSGLYLFRVDAGNASVSGKMLFMK